MTTILPLSYDQRRLLEQLDPLSAIVTFCMWNDIFVDIEPGRLHGKCIGGPLDGGDLRHHSGLCPIILMHGMPLVIQQPTTAMLETSPGHYQHRNGAWHWMAAEKSA